MMDEPVVWWPSDAAGVPAGSAGPTPSGFRSSPWLASGWMPSPVTDVDPASLIELAVVTRDRADLFARCIWPGIEEMVLEGFHVVVVDQSGDDRTETLAGTNASVDYLRSGPGLSVGRNVALSATRLPLIAFTDDDVEIRKGWLSGVARAFTSPDIGAVCGRAVTPTGELLPGRPDSTYRWPTNPFGLGSGFNIAFRRKALEDVGGFDERLGAGTRLGAGEDTDMLYRLMRAGWAVRTSNDITVVHHDPRSGFEQLALHFRYGMGAGAQTAKHFRGGDTGSLRIAAACIGRQTASFVSGILRLRPLISVLQIAFLSGFVAGFSRWRREAARPSRVGV